jgi:RNA polymerase-binding transcription factor DksA
MKKSPLTPQEIHAYETRLRKQLDALQGEVARVESDYLRPSGGERGQPDDESLEDTALDQELDALAVEDELGYAIQDALARVRAGTYGRCTTCGEWIDRERLQLVPHASECSSCARSSEEE